MGLYTYKQIRIVSMFKMHPCIWAAVAPVKHECDTEPLINILLILITCESNVFAAPACFVPFLLVIQ